MSKRKDISGEGGKRVAGHTDLEMRLGYSFANPALLIEALTHSSATKGTKRVKQNDYERLEFLGDRVLGLAISELMLETYPGEDEGRIARRLNRLVRRETCADVGRRLEVGPLLYLSNGEEKQGGRDKMTILADVCEALLGAVYLDSGYDDARSVVLKHWAGYLDKDLGSSRDPKSALQEWAQGRGYPTPRYELTGRDGPDHNPSFECEVLIGELTPTVGHGKNIREAQQAAAEAMLKAHHVSVPKAGAAVAQAPSKNAGV